MYANRNKPQAEMTATPDKYPQKVFKDKGCRNCGTVFSPQAPSHLYCSQVCADKKLVDNYLMRNYKIDFDVYLDMLKKQETKCAICSGEGWVMAEHHKMKLVVDHCHTTGKVRGLLCHNCNRGLGLMQDNKDFLLAAIQYLEGATTIP
jgi:ribosomal protein S27AE